MNYTRKLTLCLAILTATVFSGCVTLQEVGHGSKELVFNVPPAVKFDSSIQTIAVLRGKTDESGTLAARLAEELQRLQLKIMDTDALSQVSMERKLTVNRNSVTKYGDLVNVDLFFVVEWVTSSQAAFKLIEKDGRISYATFVYGNSDGKIIENVVKRLNGYTERYTLETGLTFTPGDANKDKIASMYTIGNLAGAERELQNALDSG
ncbi:MAG: hypothetical protein OEZ32_10905, partial [Nitrospinota bacterium]|nr:hypothetical protein [Nitrospinota bacterium]